MYLDEFLAHKAVISIPKGTPWSDIEEVQRLVDAHAGKPIRFGTDATIARVLKFHWNYDPMCIAYDTDGLLVYCDRDYYLRHGKSVIDIGEYLDDGIKCEPTEDFDCVFE